MGPFMSRSTTPRALRMPDLCRYSRQKKCESSAYTQTKSPDPKEHVLNSHRSPSELPHLHEYIWMRIAMVQLSKYVGEKYNVPGLRLLQFERVVCRCAISDAVCLRWK